MSEPSTLRIVRGTPTPEELAVVTAVVAAASGSGAD
ncbi:MAG: acyl-CoA carboxylase subunit epsilon, partial [Actinomycetota bacterium]|nr:acyl-CoA carboxylase subunit epsilon [Actinomycetota bacterium]